VSRLGSRVALHSSLRGLAAHTHTLTHASKTTKLAGLRASKGFLKARASLLFISARVSVVVLRVVVVVLAAAASEDIESSIESKTAAAAALRPLAKAARVAVAVFLRGCPRKSVENRERSRVEDTRITLL